MKRRTFLQALLGVTAAVAAPISLAKSKVVHRFGAMDASALELPQGVEWARYIDGMREIRCYELCEDCFLWRWDTILAGVQYNYCVKQYAPGDESLEAFSARHRKQAEQAFRNMTGMRGKIAYFQDSK